MKILFIDQNKWIELAKLQVGSDVSSGAHTAYEKLVHDVGTDQVLAPLTVGNILETSKRNDPVSRADVVNVQACLSKGFVFRSRKARILVEMTNCLHHLFQEEPVQLGRDWAIVPGFMQAFEQFDTIVASPEEATATNLINATVNPQDQYIDFMTGQDDRGRRKAHIFFAAESEALLARIENRRAIMFESSMDLRWRAYAAILFRDHLATVNRALKAIGHTFEELKGIGPDSLINFIRGVPTLDVEAHLASRLEAKTGSLHANDLGDMHSFCAAIAYADILVGEKAFVSLARQAKLDAIYGIKLFTKLNELVASESGTGVPYPDMP